MFTVNEDAVVTSAEESGPGSPTNKVKFLCSYGGKILPRPIDGLLKYVCGETRVVAVRRDITFSELMKKLGSLCEGDMVLKYQIIPEDLDALVSVRSDEDLKHMLEEHDRHESRGFPRLRTFLFPSNPINVRHENQVTAPAGSPHRLEQRYIEAINGVVHSTIQSKLRPVIAKHPKFSVSSACSTPISSCSPDGSPSEANFPCTNQNGRRPMHRVHSSPSLCALNKSNPGSPQCCAQHQHHLYQIPSGYQPQPYSASKRLTTQDFHKSAGFERVPQGRGPANHGPIQYQGPNRYNWGDSCCEEYLPNYGPGRRAGSVPHSPRHYVYRLPQGFAMFEA